jgi:predicted nucleic-acid-binding Zn-ribbon protein
MRKTKTCLKCQCKKLLHIAAVADWGDGTTVPLQAKLAVRHEGYSFMGNEKRRGVGNLEAITCSECGYTEYYVTDPKDVVPDDKNIRWLT